MSASSYAAFQVTQDYLELFSENTLNFLSRSITEELLERANKFIQVPISTIESVLNNVYSTYRQNTGDIMTRYNIDNTTPYNYIDRRDDILKRVIYIVVNDVTNNIDNHVNNITSFSAWRNPTLAYFDPVTVKLNARRPVLNFNMRF